MENIKYGKAVNLNFEKRYTSDFIKKELAEFGYVLFGKKENPPICSEEDLKKINFNRILSDSEKCIMTRGLPTEERYFSPSGFHLTLFGKWAYLIGGKSNEEAEKELSRIEKKLIEGKK